MTITAGYAFQPNGTPGSVTITYDPTVATNNYGANIQLTQSYWPAAYPSSIDGTGLGQRDFGAGVGVPFRLNQGTSFRCPHGEAAALVAAGAAVWV